MRTAARSRCPPPASSTAAVAAKAPVATAPSRTSRRLRRAVRRRLRVTGTRGTSGSRVRTARCASRTTAPGSMPSSSESRRRTRSCANGTGVRQITRPPPDAVDSLNGPPSAIPDGSTLVFDRSTPDAAGIFRVGLDGRGELEVPAPTGVPGDGWPVVSPDGARIAVARASGHQDQFDDLKTGLYVLGFALEPARGWPLTSGTGRTSAGQHGRRTVRPSSSAPTTTGPASRPAAPRCSPSAPTVVACTG